MEIQAAARAAPSTENTSVRTKRVARTRRYLTSREVEKLMKAARDTGRYGHRDATMILIAYRHGLRACELCDLQWHQVELNTGHLHVRRSKRGTPSVHPMQGDEIRALRRLQREQEASPHVFASERGGPVGQELRHAIRAPRQARRHALHHLPAHAAPRLRLRPGQCRARHAGAAGLARAQEHPAHGALQRAGTGSV